LVKTGSAIGLLSKGLGLLGKGTSSIPSGVKGIGSGVVNNLKNNLGTKMGIGMNVALPLALTVPSIPEGIQASRSALKEVGETASSFGENNPQLSKAASAREYYEFKTIYG